MTDEKSDRRVQTVAAEDLKSVKFEEATIMATSLQVFLRRSWTAKAAWILFVEEYYNVIGEFVKENEWFEILTISSLGYLKTQHRMRNNGYVKALILLCGVFWGIYSQCPSECQEQWWGEMLGTDESAGGGGGGGGGGGM